MPNNRWRRAMDLRFFEGMPIFWFNRPSYKRAYKIYFALIRSGKINSFPKDKQNFSDTVGCRMQGGIAEMDERCNQKVYTTDFIFDHHNYEVPTNWKWSKKKSRGR